MSLWTTTLQFQALDAHFYFFLTSTQFILSSLTQMDGFNVVKILENKKIFSENITSFMPPRAEFPMAFFSF